jgi:hypothetical protein
MTHHSSRTGEIDAEHEVWHTRFGLAPLVPPPYPRRLRSRMSSVHRSPLHAPGFPGAPMVWNSTFPQHFSIHALSVISDA